MEKLPTSPTRFIPRLSRRFPTELNSTVNTMSAAVRLVNDTVFIAS
jgi:hypothetical protein